MLKSEKFFALIFFVFATIIVIGMLNGRPPMAVSTTPLDYVVNSLFALMTVFLGIFFFTIETQKIMGSKAAFTVVRAAGLVAGGAAMLISIYRLIVILLSDFVIFN